MPVELLGDHLDDALPEINYWIVVRGHMRLTNIFATLILGLL